MGLRRRRGPFFLEPDAIGVLVFQYGGEDLAEGSCPAEVLVGVSAAGAVCGCGVDADFVGGVVEGVSELEVGVFGEGGAGFDVPGAVVFAEVFAGVPVFPAVEVGFVVGVVVVELDGSAVLFHEDA